MQGRQMTDGEGARDWRIPTNCALVRAVKPLGNDPAPEAAPPSRALAHEFNNAIATLLLGAQLLIDQLLPDHPLRAELVEVCAAAERAAALGWQLVPGSGVPGRGVPGSGAPGSGALAMEASPAPIAAPLAGTVLVVEDDEHVRAAVLRVLASRGFRVLEAADGSEAESLAQAEEIIDLVLTDLELPDLPGIEVARRVCERHGEARVLFMSGSAQQVPTDRFLSKPFTPQQLLRLVRLALEAAP